MNTPTLKPEGERRKSLAARLGGALASAGMKWGTLNRNARLYVISNTLQAATAGAVGVLYSLFLVSLGYSTTFIGAALVVATIGGGLGIIPANPLVRRLGWRSMLIWSDLIGGVAIAAQIIYPTAPVIMITMLGVGASVAIVLVINTPLLAAYSTPAERTALFGLNNATNFLATIAGTLLGGILPGWFMQRSIDYSSVLLPLHHILVAGTEARSYQLALLVSGVLALPSIIPVFMMDNLPRRPEGAESKKAELPSSIIAASLLERWQSLREQMTCWLGTVRRYAASVSGRFSVTQALVGFGAGIFFPYVSLYFVNTLHTTVAYFGVLSASLSVVVAVTSLVAAPLAARFGNLKTAIVVQVISIPFLITVGIAPLLWVISLAYLVRAALMAINNPPLQTFLMEAVDRDQRVLASSVYNVSFQVAWALGAGAGGLLVATVGSRAPFLVAAPFYAVSAVLLWLWFD
jgi:MFS family permease